MTANVSYMFIPSIYSIVGNQALPKHCKRFFALSLVSGIVMVHIVFFAKIFKKNPYFRKYIYWRYLVNIQKEQRMRYHVTG